ncbi:hypothetical protein [Pseudoduganella namucuonensis]|uniref:Uncharacterized protein n=1 Tax=Pseudoduganella namucuonensis TaxID=1035707 RepID=A0A1I7J5Y6_9BURK|nr:hypothetical protein [Pseudoduganella namucuonensis]SFU80557.1 hypothetical protein SAMN05216552_101085 [Pseudoduganella namucuonensis]
MTEVLSAGDIATLADSISACADELHARIMKAIREHPPGGAPGPGLGHDAAQALFDQEVELRQHANGLYVQAARLAAAGLGTARQDLLDLAAVARRRIRHAALAQDLAGVAAGVLGLAAAIAAGKPEKLPAAVRDLRDHFARVKEDRA